MKKSIVTIAMVFLSAQAFAGKNGDAHHSGHEHKHEHTQKNKQSAEKSVKVEIGKKGFNPESPLNFKPNENIVLNITRTTKKTCMTELRHPKTGKLVDLPMNKEVRFDVGTYDKPTEIKLLCGMKMKAGVIHVSGKSSKI
jgi:plastocyanin domain-containing protein